MLQDLPSIRTTMAIYPQIYRQRLLYWRAHFSPLLEPEEPTAEEEIEEIDEDGVDGVDCPTPDLDEKETAYRRLKNNNAAGLQAKLFKSGRDELIKRMH